MLSLSLMSLMTFFPTYSDVLRVDFCYCASVLCIRLAWKLLERVTDSGPAVLTGLSKKLQMSGLQSVCSPEQEVEIVSPTIMEANSDVGGLVGSLVAILAQRPQESARTMLMMGNLATPLLFGIESWLSCAQTSALCSKPNAFCQASSNSQSDLQGSSWTRET